MNDQLIHLLTMTLAVTLAGSLSIIHILSLESVSVAEHIM